MYSVRGGNELSEAELRSLLLLEREQEMFEKSALGLFDPKMIAEDPAHDWEHDADLLDKLAVLSGMMPLNLLRKISWSVGEGADTALFRMGQPLSTAVRTRLQALLKGRMQVEYETIENCCYASSQIAHLVPYVVGLAVISLLLID